MFDQCVLAVPKRKFDGLGFVFSADDRFVGIDIDNCLDSVDDESDPVVKDWALPIIQSLDGTYAEVSPSGTGIKFFAIGKNPFQGCATGRKADAFTVLKALLE